jgi:hypothetical protein
MKNAKLTANSWNAYILTIMETMNYPANNGDASFIQLQVLLNLHYRKKLQGWNSM